MKEFKSQRIDTNGVIVRVKELFRGHKELILGFNTFLPKGYEIEADDVADDVPQEPPGPPQPKPPPPKTHVEFDQAINYVNKIKHRFQQDERVYKAFLEILNMYRKGLKTIAKVYEEVATLFADHADLLEEFTYFLPDSTPPATQPKDLVVVGVPSLNAMPPGKKETGTVKAGPRHSAGPSALGTKAKPSGEAEIRRPGHKRKSTRRADIGPPPKPAAESEGTGDQEVREKERKGKEAREVVKEEKEEDIDKSADIPADDRKPTKAANLAKELAFFEKVKARLRNRDAYQEFLKCLNLFSQDIISRIELQGLAGDILGRFPELLVGFNEFLARCETMDFEFGDPGKPKELRVAAGPPKEIPKVKVGSMRERYLSRPVSELDLSTADRCTPSYRLLPKNYPKLRCSGRTKLCHSVLNDSWVSVTSGSEENTFKNMRKNQYEEALFRCEDDRYELDMVVESNTSTLKLLAQLNEQINSMTADERASFQIGDALTPIHTRCIERIYGDHGPDIVELLFKNPIVAIPVILSRLKQKDDEWRTVRGDMNKVWGEVYAKNYYKALDHRSFYFKQTDKKSLSARGLIAEIKEVSERRRHDEDNLQNIAAIAANMQATTPDLLYEFLDPAVHEDIFQIIKFSADEILSQEQSEKVLSFWTEFMEVFYGVDRNAAAARSDSIPDQSNATRADAAASTGAANAAQVDAVRDSTKGASPNADAGKDPEGRTADAEIARATEGTETVPATDATVPDAPQKATTDEGEDFSEEEKKMKLCKPLAPYSVQAEGAEAPLHSSSTQGDSHIFYGHDAFYLLFRLHQTLYERLLSAKSAGIGMDKRKRPASAQPGVPPSPPTSSYNTFKQSLFNLLDGTTENTKYEDDCRTVLGTGSYILFTLDKLIFKVIKQLQTVASDDFAAKLVALYWYEGRRPPPFQDSVYHANACIYLHDDSCYRFEQVKQPVPSVRITLMDRGPDKTEVPVGALDEAFGAYLRVFLHSKPELTDKRVFLSRNVRNKEGEVSSGAVEVVNGLECKISCNTSKVSYVLDTEDLLFRRKRRSQKRQQQSNQQQLSAKLQRYHKWLGSSRGGAPTGTPTGRVN
eukprot:jgi/Chlat1/1665/Chrsp127S08674